MIAAVAFLAGGLFAAGLALSGMTQPERVLGFLDFAHWDPTLAAVMVGAIAVHALAQRLRPRLRRPLFAPAFPSLGQRRIDGRLLGGAALFGVGWGLGGFCPGPALVSLAALTPAALAFFPGLALGMVLFRLLVPAGTRACEDASDPLSR